MRPIARRPWTSYALRVLCCVLMFLSGYALLSGSTFALRMRGDLPVKSIVVVLAGFFAFFPLARPRHYLRWLIVAAFVFTLIGGYWWTTIPWDELIKDSGFPTAQKPTLIDFALVATPAIVVAFFVVASRPSIMHADLRARGADADEALAAAAVSFLAGAVLLVICGALAIAMWLFMSAGLASALAAPIPRGVPALIVVGALGTLSYAILARRLPGLKHPWVEAARRAAARGTRGRRS